MRPITEFLMEFQRAMPPMMADDREPHGGLGDQAESEEDPALMLAEARRSGMEEGQAIAQIECLDRLAALRDAHAAELADARALWAEAEGAALAAAFTTGLGGIEAAIARSLAAALMPTLDHALRARAAEEIADAVRQLLSGAQGTLIEVSGPADLLAPVRLAFDGNPAVSITDSDAPEVSVIAGDALVASQVEVWRERLQAALELPA